MPLIPKDAYRPYLYAGSLRFCFSLQAPTNVRAATGATTVVWNEIDPFVWCEKIPLRGAQTFYAQSFAPDATVALRCRYRTDIDAGMQLVDAQYTYTIMHPPIDVDGNNSVILMYVRELRVAGPAV